MMQYEGSPWELLARHRSGCALALAAAFAGGCATGVDVTEGELAQICNEPNTTCGGAGRTTGSIGGSGTSLGGSPSGGTLGANGGSAPSNGGSISGSSGTNSTSGSGGLNGTSGNGGGSGTLQPLAEGDCLPTSDVVILYADRRNGMGSTNEPSMVLSVQNPASSFNLDALTIRYWFTADGASNFMGNIDYAQLDGQQNLTGSVQVSFGQELGSDYAELSFQSSASVGSEGVNQVQLRFHANPYTDMDQTNDFSFLGGATAGTPNRNITPYLNGDQVGGCIPRGS